MADPLHAMLGRCCVSINDNGTGFFVGPTHILTCAHVLDRQVAPGAGVTVISADGTARTARLEHLVSEHDLALLNLDGAKETAVILAMADAELAEEERLFVVGFPVFDKSLREVASLSVVYDGSSDAITQRRLQFKGNNVVGGFSGSPLLNLHTGHVMGMVIESRGKGNVSGGWAVPTETILENLPELGAATRTDVAAWAQVLEERQGFIDPSSPGLQPTLQRFAESGSNPLDFAARKVGFTGRNTEMADLDGFLDHPAPFAWRLMTGPGGAGKSRLALELCLAAAPAWRAGFVEKSQLADLRFWRQWRPNRPTLLVIDYAGPFGETAGNLVRVLLAKQYRPEFPLRLLLIERQRGEWFDAFAGRGTTDRSAVLSARYPGRDGPDLTLGPLADADLGRILAGAAVTDGSESRRDSTLAKLATFDPERRALFAILLAVTPAYADDRVAAVREIVRRERLARWEPAGCTEEDVTLLAMSTILSGAARPQLQGRGPWLDRALGQLKTSRYRQLTGQTETGKLGYLKPNVVGELFVLDWLQDLPDEDAVEPMPLAWAIDADAVAGFMIRALIDYPEHPGLPRLMRAPAGHDRAVRFWSSAIVDITRHMPARYVALGEWLLTEVEQVAALWPDDAEELELLARLTLNVGAVCGRADLHEAARACRAKLDALIARHPDPMRARRLKARALTGDIVDLIVLDEREMAGPLSPAPFTFLPSVNRLAQAQQIFDQISPSITGDQGYDELADIFAIAAFHMILGYARPAILFHRIWMPAALLLEQTVRSQLDKAEAIYLELQRVGQEASPGSDACLFLARGAAALSAAYVNLHEVKPIARLRNEIAAVADRASNDPRVREELSRIAFNLVQCLKKAGNVAEAKKATAWLDDFAATHADEAFVQERRKRANGLFEPF